MNIKMTLPKVISLSLLLIVSVSGCGIFPVAATSTPTLTPSPFPTNTLPPPTQEPSPTFTEIPPTPVPPTETVTPLPVIMETATATQGASHGGTSRCYGLNGRIEVRVLVPEAAGIGFKPFSIGEIPFAVTTEYAPYRVQGRSKLVYKGKTEEDWGTYKGDINMLGTVSGQCLTGEHDGELRLTVGMTGSQLIVIRARGFHRQLPWTGNASMPLTFFLSEGYSITGEQWQFVLHKGITE